jgi:hypothetical protein
MAIINKCQVALRIFGDDLVPEELSHVFDHFYTTGWIKGYKYSTSSGAVVEKKTGAWILEAEPSESGDFDGQISQLLSHTNVTGRLGFVCKKIQDGHLLWLVHARIERRHRNITADVAHAG